MYTRDTQYKSDRASVEVAPTAVFEAHAGLLSLVPYISEVTAAKKDIPLPSEVHQLRFFLRLRMRGVVHVH